MAQQVYHHHKVKIIQQCQVSPPPGSVSTSSIPLAFFDLPWVYSVPVQIIFFYEFPHSIKHFLQNVLPNLKHSLSLTLQHFFPLAANLVFPPQPHHPHILYSNSDSLSFTIAESTQDLHHLIANTLRDVRDLYPFVPTLPAPRTSQDGTRLFPLMAIQVTVLPSSGFSICLTYRHLAADARAFLHFMKFWANVCGTRKDLASSSLEGSLPLPFLNRDTIEDPKGIKLIYLQELWDSSAQGMEFNDPAPNFLSDKVRLSFVLSRDHVEKLKKWVSVQCNSYGLELESLHISTFVVTSSLTWVCLAKSEGASFNDVPNNDETHTLTFLADCRNRLELSIPTTYFGNCLVLRVVSLEKRKLVEDNGIVEAVIAIGSKVRDVQCEPLKGVESFMSDIKKTAKSRQHVIKVAGSPKLGVYDIDFGWGKPKKSEILHIEYSGSLSLSDCRDNKGGVEVGLVLGRPQANNFNIILEQHLKNIAVCD